MKVVFSGEQLRHRPRQILGSGALEENLEVPERAECLLTAAIESGLEHEQPEDYGLAPIAAVHSPEYLHFLQHIHQRWLCVPGVSTDVIPNVHPHARDVVYPDSIDGLVGYHVFDGSSPIAADTWNSARWSAYSAVHAAHVVSAGASSCYALARPPGHHAGRDLAGGYCYLNNSAIAAEVLLTRHERVAILDVDVHHGNGTQSVFYNRDDVLTVSIHGDPVHFYPYFWGSANECGAGRGQGYNYNLPLPLGTGDRQYLVVLEQALLKIESFAPGALVIALGLDAFAGDPHRGFAITTTGFGRIAERIATLRLPTVLVQEGGYLCDSLGDNLSAFLQGIDD